jgi:hypothetical protein
MDGSERPPTQHVQVLGLEANAERNEGLFDGLRRAYRRSGRRNPGKGRTEARDAALARGRGNAGAAGGVAKSSLGWGRGAVRCVPCSSGSRGVDSLCCAGVLLLGWRGAEHTVGLDPVRARWLGAGCVWVEGTTRRDPERGAPDTPCVS